MHTKLLLSFLLSGFSSLLIAQNVNIPDNNLKNLLVVDTFINTNQDTEIQILEAQTFSGTINVSNANISNLTGIEAFTSLSHLDCSYNLLTNLDVNANTALISLNCLGNQLPSLDLSSNPILTHLDCGANQLTTLSTFANPLLVEVICNNNQLTTVDFNANTALTKLICSGNQLNDLAINTNSNLDTLNCSFNQISDLDFSNNIMLKHLQVQNNSLSSINLGTINSLVDFLCYNNDLIHLDLSNLTNLTSLECNNNNMLSLDLSSCTALRAVWCYSNNLEDLNVQNGNNLNFTDFDAQSNPFLTCIMVDSVAYSTTNWGLIDPASVFSTLCTPLNIQNISEERSIIHPTPAFNYLTIEQDETNPAYYYRIINISGQCVKEQSLNSNTIRIDNLEKGSYFLQLLAKEHPITHQFIKA